MRFYLFHFLFLSITSFSLMGADLDNCDFVGSKISDSSSLKTNGLSLSTDYDGENPDQDLPFQMTEGSPLTFEMEDRKYEVTHVYSTCFFSHVEPYLSKEELKEWVKALSQEGDRGKKEKASNLLTCIQKKEDAFTPSGTGFLEKSAEELDYYVSFYNELPYSKGEDDQVVINPNDNENIMVQICNLFDWRIGLFSEQDIRDGNPNPLSTSIGPDFGTLKGSFVVTPSGKINFIKEKDEDDLF